MVLYIWKSKRGYMGYPNQEKLQMIDLSYTQESLDKSQHPSPQVYGGTEPPPFIFHW